MHSSHPACALSRQSEAQTFATKAHKTTQRYRASFVMKRDAWSRRNPAFAAQSNIVGARTGTSATATDLDADSRGILPSARPLQLATTCPARLSASLLH